MRVCVCVSTCLCVYVFMRPCVYVVVYGRCVFDGYLYASSVCIFACARVCVCVCQCAFCSAKNWRRRKREGREATYKDKTTYTTTCFVCVCGLAFYIVTVEDIQSMFMCSWIWIKMLLSSRERRIPILSPMVNRMNFAWFRIAGFAFNKEPIVNT